MNQNQIFQLISNQINLVIPELAQKVITPSDSLRALGANSVDRAEIIMLTMSALKVKIPLIEFAKAENIEGIVDIFHQYVLKEDYV